MRFVGLRDFAADRNGSTSIEYGILAAGIGLTLAVTVSLLGDRMVTTYGNIANALIAEDGGPNDPPDCSKECTKNKKDKQKKGKKKI